MFSYVPVQFATCSTPSTSSYSRPAKRSQQYHPSMSLSSYYPHEHSSSTTVDPLSLLFGNNATSAQPRTHIHHPSYEEESASSSSEEDDDYYSSCDEEHQYYEFLDAKRRERELQELAEIQAKRRAQEEAAFLEAKRRKHAAQVAAARARAKAEAEARAAIEYKARMEAEYRRRQQQAEAEAQARAAAAAAARAHAIKLQRQRAREQEEQQEQQRRIRAAYEEDLARQILWHSLMGGSPQSTSSSSSSSPQRDATPTPRAATPVVRPVEPTLRRSSPNPGSTTSTKATTQPIVFPLPHSSSSSSSSPSTSPVTMDYTSAVHLIQARAKEQIAVRQSLKSVGAVREKYEGLKRELGNLPESLVFDTAKSLESDAPVLQYSSNNLPFRRYEESLTQLLTSLDEISSKGSERVKSERKNLVLEIENELSRLDAHKIQLWQTVKQELQRSSEKVEPVTSTLGDAVMAVEATEEPAGAVAQQSEGETQATPSSALTDTTSASDAMETDAPTSSTTNVVIEPEQVSVEEPTAVETEATSILPSHEDSMHTDTLVQEQEPEEEAVEYVEVSQEPVEDTTDGATSNINEEAEVASLLIPPSVPSSTSSVVEVEKESSDSTVEASSIPLPADTPSPAPSSDHDAETDPGMEVEPQEVTAPESLRPTETTSASTTLAPSEPKELLNNDEKTTGPLPLPFSTPLGSAIEVVRGSKDEYQTHVDDEDDSDSDTSFEML